MKTKEDLTYTIHPESYDDDANFTDYGGFAPNEAWADGDRGPIEYWLLGAIGDELQRSKRLGTKPRMIVLKLSRKRNKEEMR